MAEDDRRRLDFCERHLSLCVALCTVIGVVLGKLRPGVIDALRRLEFGGGSRISVPSAALIWLMIYPMMSKVDFASVIGTGRREHSRPCPEKGVKR